MSEKRLYSFGEQRPISTMETIKIDYTESSYGEFYSSLWIIGGIALFLIAIFSLIVYGIIEESKSWEKFKTKHHCKIVSHVEGDVFTTMSSDGSGNMIFGTGTTSDQTGCRCDDGVTYFR